MALVRTFPGSTDLLSAASEQSQHLGQHQEPVGDSPGTPGLGHAIVECTLAPCGMRPNGQPGSACRENPGLSFDRAEVLDTKPRTPSDLRCGDPEELAPHLPVRSEVDRASASEPDPPALLDRCMAQLNEGFRTRFYGGDSGQRNRLVDPRPANMPTSARQAQPDALRVHIDPQVERSQGFLTDQQGKRQRHEASDAEHDGTGDFIHNPCEREKHSREDRHQCQTAQQKRAISKWNAKVTRAIVFFNHRPPP